MSLELNKQIENLTWNLTCNISLIDELRRKTLPKLKFNLYIIPDVCFVRRYDPYEHTYREELSKLGFKEIDIDVSLMLSESIHKIEEMLGLDRGTIASLNEYLGEYSGFLYDWYCSACYDGRSGWRNVVGYYELYGKLRSMYPTFNDLRDWIISTFINIFRNYLVIRTFTDKYGIIEPFKRYVYHKMFEYGIDGIISNIGGFVRELEKYKDIFRNMGDVEVRARKVSLGEVIEFANKMYDRLGDITKYGDMYGFASTIKSNVTDGKYTMTWVEFDGSDVTSRYVTMPHYEYYYTYPEEFRKVLFGIFAIVKEIVNARHKISKLEELYNEISRRVNAPSIDQYYPHRQITYFEDSWIIRGPKNKLEEMIFNVLEPINKKEHAIIEALRVAYNRVVNEIINRYRPQRKEFAVYKVKLSEWKIFDVVDGIMIRYPKEVYMSVGENNRVLIQLVYDNDVYNKVYRPNDFTLYYVDLLLNYPFEVEKKVKIPTISYEEIIDRIL